MNINECGNNRRRGKKIWSIGSISILLLLFPQTAFAHDSTAILLLFGVFPLIFPLLLGGILLWWKRQELVIKRGIVTVMYIVGLFVIWWSIIIGIQLLPAGLFKNMSPTFDGIFFLILNFGVPMGSGVLLAWALYRWFRVPLSTTETQSGENSQEPRKP